MISLNYPLLLLKDGNGETPWDRMAIKMKSVAPLRIVEIGDKPYIKFAYPDQTAYFSTYFAGGGIQGGRAIGKSDAIGAYPAENAVEPSQVVATIYKSLGFHFDTALPGPNGRPFPLVDFGKQEIKELF